jgi:hypothetical protein
VWNLKCAVGSEIKYEGYHYRVLDAYDSCGMLLCYKLHGLYPANPLLIPCQDREAFDKLLVKHMG